MQYIGLKVSYTSISDRLTNSSLNISTWFLHYANKNRVTIRSASLEGKLVEMTQSFVVWPFTSPTFASVRYPTSSYLVKTNAKIHATKKIIIEAFYRNRSASH